MKEKINIAIDKLFAKPLIGIPISVLAFYLFMLLGELAPSMVVNYSIRLVLGGIITIFVFRLRGDRMYSCGFKKHGFKGLLCSLPFVILAILLFALRYSQYTNVPFTVFLYTGILSLEAGFCEEMMVRGIPLGNTVWKQKSLKEIIGLAVYTSVIFGVLHLGNALRTGSFAQAGLQTIVSIFAGIYLAVCYLRTGSIIPGIIAHFLWDYANIFDPNKFVNGDMIVYTKAAEQSTAAEGQAVAATGSLTTIVSLFTICFYVIFSLILLRKSKRNVIMDNFTKV